MQSDPPTGAPDAANRRGAAAPSIKPSSRPSSAPASGAGRKTWIRIGVAVALLVAAASVARARRPRLRSAPESEIPAKLVIERDGLRWDFDAMRGRERLVDLSVPAEQQRNLIAERPADAARLRREALKEAGVENLDRMIEAHKEAAEALRRLGYL